MLNDGLSLAALIDALLRSSAEKPRHGQTDRASAWFRRFHRHTDFGSPSHLKYFYDRPKSLHVVDIAVVTLDHGTIASTDIRLRLMASDN